MKLCGIFFQLHKLYYHMKNLQNVNRESITEKFPKVIAVKVRRTNQ